MDGKRNFPQDKTWHIFDDSLLKHSTDVANFPVHQIF